MERPVTTEDLDLEARTRGLEERARPTPPLDGSDGRRRVLDRYRLERRLGAGGFGVVWLAFDERLEREVAVKIMPRDGDEPMPARASREARAAARLNHPGIVALYELAADYDAVYLVSELVPGRTLAELIRAGAVSDRDVARIGGALCEALAHAHAKKVIHRDVKPGNVIVVSEPAAGAGFAKLADFGVAHLASGDPLTRTGDVVGTLAYMAPEQAEGQRVTTAADVYSLALTLYEAWTGRNPVRAEGPVATARRLGTRLPPLGGVRRDLPLGLCRTIDAALDPDPERRPALEGLRTSLDSAAGALSDVGGLVEPGTLERLGLTRVRETAAALPGGRATRTGARAAAGLAAGALVLAALEVFGGPGGAASAIGKAPAEPPVSPLAAGAVTAVLVALLPRIAWLVAAAAVGTWLLLPSVGLEGDALVLAAALAAVPLLLPRAGLVWSLPGAAPLLGAIAVGPLFVAIAGLAGTAWRRAGLAAAGYLWLACAELLTGDELLLGPPDGAAPRAAFEGSIDTAAGDALWPLVESGVLVAALLWAALAAALPLLVRGRSLGADLLGGGVWCAALVAGHVVMADGLALDDPRGVVAGAALALVVAVAAAGAGLARRPENRLAGVPLGEGGVP